MSQQWPVLISSDAPQADDPLFALLQRRLPWAVDDGMFVAQLYGTGRWPDQGWKLHVSATPLSAVEVLERCLPVLLEAGVRFKVVGTRLRLMTLNGGLGGDTQAGKFITVYPTDDGQAVNLAVALDETTRGLRGPRVPTDQPLRPGSLVHYRYGAFRQRLEHTPTAAGLGPSPFDLTDAAGRLSTDQRLPHYEPAPGFPDPFAAAGVLELPEPRKGALAGRYLITGLLSRSWRGGVFRAIDLGTQPARFCLIKELWHDVGTDQYGRDAQTWGHNEAAVLERLADQPDFPRLIDVFSLSDNLYVVMEFVDGTPAEQTLTVNAEATTGLPPERLLDFARDSAEALARLHGQGIVFRDFKPANLIFTDDGRYRLIDFGIAYPTGNNDDPPFGLGTPPFWSPEQYHGEAPAFTDDVYAWGATLHRLASGVSGAADGIAADTALGAQPGGQLQAYAPAPFPPIRDRRPDLPGPLARIIDTAVRWNPVDRFADMRVAAEQLSAAYEMRNTEPDTETAENDPGAGAAVGAPSPEPTTSTSDANAERRTSAGNAESVPQAGRTAPRDTGSNGTPTTERRTPAVDARSPLQIGVRLLETAQPHLGGFCWATRQELAPGESFTPNIYDGTAGIALFLAALARATGEQRFAEGARGAVRWLAGGMWGSGRAALGLHCGEAGTGYALLRLAELLDEPGYRHLAELYARRIAGIPVTTIDLLYGAAGDVLFLVELARTSGNTAYLQQAADLGERLVASAHFMPEGGCYWDVPVPLSPEPPHAYLGLSHGAAGIGLALLRLGLATGNDRFLNTALHAANVLLAAAVSDGQGGALWPRVRGDSAVGLQAWCHGAGGVGLYFAELARCFDEPQFATAARAGLHAVHGLTPTRAHSGLCHGIAGDGILLLDAHALTGDGGYLDAARQCAGRLVDFQVKDAPGELRLGPSDVRSPDLMLGSAGVGMFLLRLEHPELWHDAALFVP